MKRPYLKLRRVSVDGDLSDEELAARIGVHTNTVSNRLCAPEDCGSWRAEEIIAICRVLHIPQEKIGEYFFPAVVKGESA